MILPQIIKIIYILGSIGLVIGGLYIILVSPNEEGVLFGVGVIFLGPFLLHLLLEVCMVKFAILETLTQIRDQNQTQNK